MKGMRKRGSHVWKQRRIRINKINILFVVLLGLVFFIFWSIDRNVYPLLLNIAKTEVKKIAQEAILMGIKEQLAMGDDLKEIVVVEKGEDGRITFVNINPAVQAKIYTQTASQIQKKLRSLQERPIYIRLGQALQSNLFSRYGPNFRVEVIPKGSIQTRLVPKLESKGINMVMVTLNLHIDSEMGVIVPFSEEQIKIKTEYPIAQAFVVGEVPQYYFYNDAQGNIQKKETDPSVSVHPPIPTQ